jgi:hypothetical protein
MRKNCVGTRGSCLNIEQGFSALFAVLNCFVYASRGFVSSYVRGSCYGLLRSLTSVSISLHLVTQFEFSVYLPEAQFAVELCPLTSSLVPVRSLQLHALSWYCSTNRNTLLIVRKVPQFYRTRYTNLFILQSRDDNCRMLQLKPARFLDSAVQAGRF